MYVVISIGEWQTVYAILRHIFNDISNWNYSNRETSDFLKQIFYLKSFISMFSSVNHFLLSNKGPLKRKAFGPLAALKNGSHLKVTSARGAKRTSWCSPLQN